MLTWYSTRTLISFVKLHFTRRVRVRSGYTYLYLLLRTRITSLPTCLSSVIRSNGSRHGNEIPDAVTQERSEARKDVARCAELNPNLRAHTSLNARSPQPQKETIQREGRPHRLFSHPQSDLAASSAMCNGSDFEAEHFRKRLYLMRKGKNESNFFWAEMERYSTTSPWPESIMQVQSHRH